MTSFSYSSLLVEVIVALNALFALNAQVCSLNTSGCRKLLTYELASIFNKDRTSCFSNTGPCLWWIRNKYLSNELMKVISENIT